MIEALVPFSEKLKGYVFKFAFLTVACKFVAVQRNYSFLKIEHTRFISSLFSKEIKGSQAGIKKKNTIKHDMLLESISKGLFLARSNKKRNELLSLCQNTSTKLNILFMLYAWLVKIYYAFFISVYRGSNFNKPYLFIFSLI